MFPSRVEITNLPELVPSYDPRNAVVLREQAGSYVVPTGKFLVLTALGRWDHSGVDLKIDGVNEVRYTSGGTGPSIEPLLLKGLAPDQP